MNANAVVLVVEDDALIRLVACDLVEEAGFVAIEASNADQAVQLLESRNDILLVFTDIDMPGSMDGLVLSHLIRDRWPPIHLLLASGKTILADGGIPTGARFFAKPYHGEHIVDALRSLMLGPEGPWKRIMSVG